MRTKSILGLAVIVCMMAVVNVASADLVQGINIDFVAIGNAGNLGDTRPEAYPNGSGAVKENYRIAKYEITAAQWQTISTAAGIGNLGGGAEISRWLGFHGMMRLSSATT
jgi:hypothetical protein